MNALAAALLDQLDDDALDQLAASLAPRLAVHLAERQPSDDRWLTSAEAAAYLALTLDALHKRTRRREIPCTQERPGGRLFFRRADLDRWRLESHCS